MGPRNETQFKTWYENYKMSQTQLYNRKVTDTIIMQYKEFEIHLAEAFVYGYCMGSIECTEDKNNHV